MSRGHPTALRTPQWERPFPLYLESPRIAPGRLQCFINAEYQVVKTASLASSSPQLSQGSCRGQGDDASLSPGKGCRGHQAGWGRVRALSWTSWLLSRGPFQNQVGGNGHVSDPGVTAVQAGVTAGRQELREPRGAEHCRLPPPATRGAEGKEGGGAGPRKGPWASSCKHTVLPAPYPCWVKPPPGKGVGPRTVWAQGPPGHHWGAQEGALEGLGDWNGASPM